MITICDRLGNIKNIQHIAKDVIEARITFSINDKKLCRNSYVVLENTPFYEHQIVNITPV